MNGLDDQDSTPLVVVSVFLWGAFGLAVVMMWRYYEPFLRWLARHFRLGPPGQEDETIDTLVWKGRIGMAIGVLVAMVGYVGVFFLDW